MSQLPYVSQGPLQDPCLRIRIYVHVFGFMSQHLRISGSSARSMCPIHGLAFMSQHLCISGTSARSMSPDPYVSQDPLQDPCLRFMSQHLYISGSAARSILRIHVSASSNLRILCKIHVSDSCLSNSCLSIHLYLRILCKIHVSGVSASSYLRILYKIHVFGFMSQHPLIWILYKIHVFGLISQHLCISGSSARSMSPDPYISIHMYLRILCKIHVPGFISQLPYAFQDPLQDPCLRIRI